jgi:hypothetical protein
MSEDLSPILNDWGYEPEEVRVRMITGDDGRPKIQLRVDLGVLQMERDGRPDGERPEGFESWLDYFEHQQHLHDAAHPDSAVYQLGADDCIRLWREGIQFYHRYLAFWHLEMFDLCARDTARNLRLFAFVRAHIQEDRHKMQFDQWRPYVLMMHARAVGTPLVRNGEFDKGLRAIEAGIDGIRDFLDEYQQSDRAEECAELLSLEQWRDEILARDKAAAASRPQSAMDVLRRRLEHAVAAEEFEEAARLRDEIRHLGNEAKMADDK